MVESYITDLIRALYKEYIDKNGDISCEIAIDRGTIDEVFQFVENNNLTTEKSKWVASECKTCQEYHGEQYVHFQLVTLDYINENVENIIRISK